MRMSHVYQPVVLLELLRHRGAASKTEIARAATRLARDAAQIEYYEQITRDMVGRVLTNNHGIADREGDTLADDAFQPRIHFGQKRRHLIYEAAGCCNGFLSGQVSQARAEVTERDLRILTRGPPVGDRSSMALTEMRLDATGQGPWRARPRHEGYGPAWRRGLARSPRCR
jgi:hypothetical protein